MATTTFNDLITFSRGSNATVTGPNGLIQWAPNNLLTNSQDFESIQWVAGLATPATVTSNTAAAPDGSFTADTLAITAPAPVRRNQPIVGSVPGFLYTASVWVKAAPSGSATHFRLTSNNTATWGTGASSKVALTSEWQRVTITWTQVTTSLTYVIVGASDVTGANDPDCYGNVLVWGAQLELGSTATTYNNTSVRNLLGFSEAFDNAAWSKVNVSIVTGAQANPVNNLFNAQKLMENTAASTQHYTRQNPITVASGAVVTLSVYAKAGERRYLGLLEGYSNKGRYFDLQTGTVGNVLVGAPSSASITAVGNGWYRCSITTTAPATTVDHEIYLSADGSSLSYTGDGNSGVYIYGAMLSNSASLDPYVPTPGAAPSSTAYYGPRFDYDPVTLLPRGLLIEEQRVNLVLRSAEFDNASWNKITTTVTANADTAPDGTVTADRIAATSANSLVYQTVAGLSNTTTYTLSVWVKLSTAGATASLAFYTAGGGTTIGSQSFTTTGQWQRVTLTATTGTLSGETWWAIGGGNTFATGEEMLIWGAQLEAGAFATSYIPTIASTVTRSADVATITGSLFSQWYNQPEGAIFVDFVSPVTGDRTAVNPSDGTNNNRMTIGFTASAPNNLAVFTGNVLQALIGAGTQTAGVVAKMGVAYRLNDFASTTGGATPATDTSGTVPTVNQLNMGSLAIGGSLNGWLRSIRYVPVRAADFQLQALTAPPELLSSNIYDRFNDLVLDRAGQTIEVR